MFRQRNSLPYSAGVTAAELRRYLSNMNVVSKSSTLSLTRDDIKLFNFSIFHKVNRVEIRMFMKCKYYTDLCVATVTEFEASFVLASS